MFDRRGGSWAVAVRPNLSFAISPSTSRTSRSRAYFGFYNRERLHQSLDYRTPAEVDGVGAKTA
ncbi:MAG TPA: hypothetical protein VH092_07550 [Urbifossiella sp.]|jgi:hypothetical protein|nr:hypothetical protein [Urbifossiella sp.]